MIEGILTHRTKTHGHVDLFISNATDIPGGNVVKIAHNDKVIATFTIEMVWDMLKKSLADYSVDDRIILERHGLSRRVKEAQRATDDTQ